MTPHDTNSPMRLRGETIALRRELRELDHAAPVGGDAQENTDADRLDANPLAAATLEELQARKRALVEERTRQRAALAPTSDAAMARGYLTVDQAAETLGVATRRASELLAGVPRRLSDRGGELYAASDLETFLADRADGRDGRRYL